MHDDFSQFLRGHLVYRNTSGCSNAVATPLLASSTRYIAHSRGTHTRGKYTRIAGECHQGMTVAALGQCRNFPYPGGSHTFVAMQFCHCTNDVVSAVAKLHCYKSVAPSRVRKVAALA